LKRKALLLRKRNFVCRNEEKRSILSPRTATDHLGKKVSVKGEALPLGTLKMSGSFEEEKAGQEEKESLFVGNSFHIETSPGGAALTRREEAIILPETIYLTEKKSPKKRYCSGQGRSNS